MLITSGSEAEAGAEQIWSDHWRSIFSWVHTLNNITLFSSCFWFPPVDIVLIQDPFHIKQESIIKSKYLSSYLHPGRYTSKLILNEMLNKPTSSWRGRGDGGFHFNQVLLLKRMQCFCLAYGEYIPAKGRITIQWGPPSSIAIPLLCHNQGTE